MIQTSLPLFSIFCVVSSLFLSKYIKRKKNVRVFEIRCDMENMEKIRYISKEDFCCCWIGDKYMHMQKTFCLILEL